MDCADGSLGITSDLGFNLIKIMVHLSRQMAKPFTYLHILAYRNPELSRQRQHLQPNSPWDQWVKLNSDRLITHIPVLLGAKAIRNMS